MHGGATCRFKYPRPLSEHTRLLQPGEYHRRHDLRRCDFYLTERRPGEERVVPYNKDILLAWGANMDLQLVGNQHATNVYVGGYMTKCETEGLQEAIQNTLQQLPATSSAKQRLTRIGTTCFANRACSQQEQLYLTSGLVLREASRVVESLCVAYPQHRPRLLNTAAMQAATAAAHPDQGSDSDDDDNARPQRAQMVQLGKFDYYQHRPEGLKSCTLSQFVR